MKFGKTNSLTHKLLIGTMMMVGFTLLLSISIIASFYETYRRSEENLAALTRYRQVLVAANVLSAERGPSNAVLGEEPSTDSPSRRRLAELRLRSDAALEALIPADPADAKAIAPMVSPDAVRNVRIRLAVARAAVDALAAKPLNERSLENIRSVIDNMFAVVDQLQPIVTTSIDHIVENDDSLSGVVLMAQLFSDMREFAGRIGSYVMPAVAAHQPMDPESIARFRESNGRLHELWHLARWRAGFYNQDPELVAAGNEIGNRYFGFGLPMINAVIERGRYSGEFGISTADLTDRYVATMQPIERVRMAFLDQTIERPKEMRATALKWLIYVSVVAGLIIVVNIAIILYIRHMVFRPLFAAADEIVALSEGRETEMPSGAAWHGTELGGLFTAIRELRLRLRERVQYTERLRVYAETDGLTTLANRRLFDRIGSGDAEFADMATDVGIIMLDIDHFKQINDLYGHPAGDEVLRSVADILRAHSRADDVAARYGGEEFVLCLAGATKRVVAERAETIRRAIEAMRITIHAGQQFGVTASFGISTGERGPETWDAAIGAADRALYQAKSLGRNRVCEAEPLNGTPAFA
jgi:diguanylate cyclase (GGDEF)-like protein